MPTCRNCKVNFDGAYRSRYCCIKCRLDFKSVLNSDTGCVEWIGAKQKAGYGAVNTADGVKSTHRLAFEDRFGEIPDGMFVCHRCDNPSCINVDHLFLGTNEDNVQDMKSKGRAAWANKEMPDWIKDRIRKANATAVRTVSEAQRLKTSEMMKKRWESPEWREKFSELMSGENNPCSGVMPQERREKFKESWAAKVGVSRGPMSEETKRKISEANKGRKDMVGRVISEATRQKMREAAKTRESRKREVFK